MSDFDSTYNAAMAEARQIDAEGRRRFDAVAADPTLTPEGKKPRFAEVDSWRAQQVDALQNRMALELAGEKAALRVDIESGRADLAKGERKLLADYPAAALLLAERELAATETAELAAKVEAARDPAERFVLARLALAEAQKRGKDDPAAGGVATVLQAATMTEEAIAIRDMEQRLAMLERDGDGLITALDRRAVANRMHASGLISNPALFEMNG